MLVKRPDALPGACRSGALHAHGHAHTSSDSLCVSLRLRARRLEYTEDDQKPQVRSNQAAASSVLSGRRHTPVIASCAHHLHPDSQTALQACYLHAA